MKQLLAILFATAFTLLVSVLAGRLILGLLRVKISRLEQRFLAFILGSAALSTVVFILTAAGQAHRGTLLAAGLLIVAVALRRGAHRPSASTNAPADPPLAREWKIIFLICYAAFAVLYFGNALLPEFSADGTGYHVAEAARYLNAHHFVHISSFVASYPQGVEMLFLFAFAFGRNSAASMVHFLFLLFAPLGILAFGRRIGSPQAGIVAGLLFFLSPIAGKNGVSAYVEVALAAAIIAVFLLLEIWRQQPHTGLLIAIGLCAGFAFAAKYPGALAIVYALGAVVIQLRRSRQPILRPASLVLSSALIIAAPWLVKNWIQVGNPVLPFASQLFPNPYFSAWSEKTIAHTLDIHRGVTLAQLPLEAAISGLHVAGVLGPIFLLTPLLLFTLGNRHGRRIALAAAIFAIPYYLDSDTRFAIPMLPFASLGIALAVTRWRIIALAIVLIHAVASWPPILKRYTHQYAWRIDGFNWRAALRITPEADFLRRQLPDYDIGLVIDKTVPGREPVFSFSGLQQAYHSHEIINEWTSSFGTRISDILRTPFTPALQPTRLYNFKFPPATAQRVRLVMEGTSPTDRWSVTELRVFANQSELPRNPQWRLTASSSPWDIQAAFDNSPVTRWASNEPFRPGMFIEIDFGRPTTFDQIEAQCTPDQGKLDMRVEYEVSYSRWQSAPGSASSTGTPPPAGLRGDAIKEIERNNIHWLLLHDLETERGAGDFFRNQQLWGIRLAASSGQYKLYALE